MPRSRQSQQADASLEADFIRGETKILQQRFRQHLPPVSGSDFGLNKLVVKSQNSNYLRVDSEQCLLVPAPSSPVLSPREFVYLL